MKLSDVEGMYPRELHPVVVDGEIFLVERPIWDAFEAMLTELNHLREFKNGTVTH